MHRPIALLVTGLLVAGCARAPSAVEPTLVAVEALGMVCGEGNPDNVPSGLVEWHCGATKGGEAAAHLILGVTVDGNSNGVARVWLAMDDDRMITDGVGTYPGPDRLRAALALVVDRVPPLTVAPALKDALRDWTGEEIATEIGNARIRAWCLLGGACSIEIGPVGNPTVPLQLP
jgi:hypothetical protein